MFASNVIGTSRRTAAGSTLDPAAGNPAFAQAMRHRPARHDSSLTENEREAGNPQSTSSTTVAGESGHGAAFDFSRTPIHSPEPVSGTHAISASTMQRALQRKPVAGSVDDPLEHEADRVADHVMRAPGRAPSIGSATKQVSLKRDAGATPVAVDDVLDSSGEPLAAPLRNFFEPRFGCDLGGVRIHANSNAASAARSLGAAAFTYGSDIAFAAGRYQPRSDDGQRLLAHELTHVVQQRGGARPAGPAAVDPSGPAEREAAAVAGNLPFAHAPKVATPRCIQRFEAGEHAQFGETGAELKSLINAPASVYVVKPGGETLAAIATAFGVSQDDLLERNKDKIKQLPLPKTKASGKKRKTVPGFAAGERIEIPKTLNPAMRDALTVNELSYEAGQPDAAGKRATVSYGEGIAMSGDLFANPGQIDATPKDKLNNLQNMIQGEKTSSKTGKFVENADWEAASDKRFSDLALHNESHFAPSNPSLATAASPASAPNHKTEWERHHTDALRNSQAGDKNKALQRNAFADHFLTDAFSAGHLINKLDVMEKFKGGIKTVGPAPMTKDSKLTPDSISFFDQVAAQAFVGPVKALFSQYELVETHAFIHFNIDSVSMFSKLLQGIYKEEPGTGMVASGVAKAVHDDLSTKSGGIPVENQKGDKWQLSGDRTLNAKTSDPKTLEIGRKAVAQSQYNVLSVFNETPPLDLPKLFKAVWDFVPQPTSAGTADIKTAVDQGTDPKQATLVSRLVQMIKNEYPTIIKKLVDLGKLRKA
jgi:LysM repeat protein